VLSAEDVMSTIAFSFVSECYEAQPTLDRSDVGQACHSFVYGSYFNIAPDIGDEKPKPLAAVSDPDPAWPRKPGQL
jgi:hypothetical protein